MKWLLAFLCLTLPAAARTWDVGPGSSLLAALSQARDGDVVRVHGGAWGPIQVTRSITLQGDPGTVLDGHGQGTVVRLRAPGTRLEGFTVRGSGDSLADENSGITLEAPRCLVANCTVDDSLFGIYINKAPGCVLEGNHITSKRLPMARRGDGIRVFFSDHVVVLNNVVKDSRDAILWYSNHLEVAGNRVTGSRYGLHFMYDDDAHLHDNLLSDNSVGVYLMYSRRLHLYHNTLSGNRGPSGYGLGMKDLDDARIEGNLLSDNRVGIWVDNSPRELDSHVEYRHNVLVGNDVGLALMPSVSRSRFSDNSFIDNAEQVRIEGEGSLHGDDWSANYWSDYTGFDADGDGMGDVPYRSSHLFEQVLDQHPDLRLLTGSLAADALDFAARAVPLVAPLPKLEDDRPLMAPHVPAGLPQASPQGSGSTGPGAGFLLLLVLGLAAAPVPARVLCKAWKGQDGMVRITGLTKRYGTTVALDNVSFEVRAGEAMALWGSNGAGKTTLLRSLLGLLSYQGQVQIGGRGPGPETRRSIGFVPQELTFHDDLTVLETMRFYARLKRVSLDMCGPLLTRMGLESHSAKLVRQLSGGLKQRLALGLALLGDPPLLLLDEPTSNLDAAGREEFMALLAQVKVEGKTLIFSSHRHDEVATLADRVLELENGRIRQSGPPLRMSVRDEQVDPTLVEARY